MADISWNQVEAIAPGLSTLDVDAQDLILGYVNATVDSAAFQTDEMFTLARVYLAAHRGTVVQNQEGSAGKVVVSEAAGGLSRSYATGTAGDMNSTAFGQEYLNLVQNSVARAPVVLF